MKERLCVDIDNCVAATDAVMRQIIAEVTNGRVNFAYEDIREFDYHGDSCKDSKGHGIDLDTWKLVHEKFSEDIHINDISAIGGAADAICELQRRYAIHFVTTRRPKARKATIDWLDRLGIDSNYSLHFVGHREKHEVVANMAAAIDDDLVQAELFAARGVKSILFAHPWNETDISALIRARSWPEITTILRDAN